MTSKADRELLKKYNAEAAVLLAKITPVFDAKDDKLDVEAKKVGERKKSEHAKKSNRNYGFGGNEGYLGTTYSHDEFTYSQLLELIKNPVKEVDYCSFSATYSDETDHYSVTSPKNILDAFIGHTSHDDIYETSNIFNYTCIRGLKGVTQKIAKEYGDDFSKLPDAEKKFLLAAQALEKFKEKWLDSGKYDIVAAASEKIDAAKENRKEARERNKEKADIQKTESAVARLRKQARQSSSGRE